MNNKGLGGGDFAHVAGPPVSGQRGVTDVPGTPSTPAFGLNNIGLLVRTWGRITELDTANPAQWFMINDESNVQTKIDYPPFACILNDFVTITGISSCEVGANGDLQRVLRPQPLTCTIEQAIGQSDPISSLPINFKIIFSEPVTDFDDSDDVSITGSAGGTKTVTITQTDSAGKDYNAAVSDVTYGSVIATVPTGKAQNTSGVRNCASTSTDNTVGYCGAVVYVQTQENGGSNSNSGWRWDDAKETVGAALQTAVQYGQTQVWVAKGTYGERVTLPAGIGLYGGFAGNETSIAQRPAFPRSSPDANETVLDGQNGGSVVTATSTNFDNTLNGFTIQNGNPCGVTSSSVLPVYNCKITSNSYGISTGANSIISGNEITNNTGIGVYLSNSSSTTVSTNKINHNGGSGIHCNTGSGYVIDRNFIEYNNTSGYGGGISFYSCTGTSTIANNFIRGNGAAKGGGIYCYGAALNIYNNTIVDNSCSTNGNGAGICIQSIDSRNLYIYNNIVAYNTNGYGMYIDNGGLNFIYTVYLNKNCTYQNGSGNYGLSGSKATFNDPNNDYQNQNPGLSGDRYHLAVGAYCINRGTTLRYYGLNDIDGEARIAGSLLDVGCDEAQ